MKWRAWFRRTPALVRVAPLEARHATRLSAIHASAFARPWTAQDFEGFLVERAVSGDGLFLGRDTQPTGFVLSRRAADEAEHLQALAYAGVRIVHLEVEDGNDPALALYRRLRFVQVGRREGYYLRPDGTRAAALSMSRTL
jgi:ribosomal-protein-alanine N-acetyltransferase